MHYNLEAQNGYEVFRYFDEGRGLARADCRALISDSEVRLLSGYVESTLTYPMLESLIAEASSVVNLFPPLPPVGLGRGQLRVRGLVTSLVWRLLPQLWHLGLGT